MEKFSKMTAKLLNQVNTHISASDWIRCAGCGHSYRPAGMGKNGICKTCIASANESYIRLTTILSHRALIEHTVERFQVMPENEEAFNAVQNFDMFRQSLFLYGECGVGKSHLSSLIVRAAINRGLRSIVVTEPSPMLREINTALMAGAEAEQRAINKFVNASLLVIDDLGTEKITDYKLEKLYEVINGRDKAMKSGLVITSNYSLQQISERLKDDRIASRLSGMCKVIKVGGQDWRLEKGQN
jgi:DNA replication protein DnaC